LEPEAEYIVMIMADGYFNNKITLSTIGMEESDEYEQTVTLKKAEPKAE
jgi:peptidoglycan-associated lipoprotein